jgi:hypothetical protein
VSRVYERIIKAYQFFCAAEKSKRCFTLEDISIATGWTLQTVQAYRSKKWYWFLQEEQDAFSCEGICEYPEKSFIRIHTQRTDADTRNLRPRFDQKIDDLIDKARESALLAVQAYNNPMAAFRTPAYLVLMNIAFTALFHAIFERDSVEYYYKKPDGTASRIIDGEPASWELTTCADYYYQNANTPERANLRFLTELRNKIEHRFLPILDITIAGQCQAMLFNFEDLLKKEFGSFFALGQSLALSLQFTEIAAHQRDALRRLQSKEYDLIRKYIESYQSDLPQEVLQSQKYSFRVFLIPRLGNHATSSNAAIEFVHYDSTKPEEMKQYEKHMAMIKDRVVHVQVANQGKLKPSTVSKRVSECTGKTFTVSDHTCAWKLYKVRPREPKPEGCRTEFCQYDEAHRDFVYTEHWVQFLIEKVTDPQEFHRIKSYREMIEQE